MAEQRGGERRIPAFTSPQLRRIARSASDDSCATIPGVVGKREVRSGERGSERMNRSPSSFRLEPLSFQDRRDDVNAIVRACRLKDEGRTRPRRASSFTRLEAASLPYTETLVAPPMVRTDDRFPPRPSFPRSAWERSPDRSAFPRRAWERGNLFAGWKKTSARCENLGYESGLVNSVPR